MLVALFVSSTSAAGRSVMDELRPEARRRTVSGGPLDGKPFAVTGYEVWRAWEQVSMCRPRNGGWKYWWRASVS